MSRIVELDEHSFLLGLSAADITTACLVGINPHEDASITRLLDASHDIIACTADGGLPIYEAFIVDFHHPTVSASIVLVDITAPLKNIRCHNNAIVSCGYTTDILTINHIAVFRAEVFFP